MAGAARLTDLAATVYRGGNTALTHRRLVYDAFGRLVRVAAVEGVDETDIALYRYNGLNMRLMWHDDADADSTLESSERFYVMFDERWRPVATFRDTDDTPKEAFVWHAAGHAGFGGSSYIDSLILRDRDHTSCGEGCDPRLAASDGTLEERRYSCQNWRADVVAVTKSDGTPLEYVRYSPYGEPTVYPVADLNMDGVVNSTDNSLWTDLLYSTSNASVYANSDLDSDGLDDWNSGGADGDLFYESYAATMGLSGVGRVSSAGVDSRTGYAGYQWDQTISANHVRYRVYLPDIGRWTRRDPLGYVDGTHRYKYSDGRPTFGVDAMGLVTLPSDPAKHPRICCGPTRDEWPFTHCEMKWGACADGEREHEVWTDRSASRSLADGTPCSSATREQITSCLGVNPHDNHPDKTKPYGLGNNCQASVASKVGQCCLLTSWSPSLHSGVREVCVEWGIRIPTNSPQPVIGHCTRYATGLTAACKAWDCGWRNSGSTGAPAVWGCDCTAWGTPSGKPDLSLPEDPFPRARPPQSPRSPGRELP